MCVCVLGVGVVFLGMFVCTCVIGRHDWICQPFVADISCTRTTELSIGLRATPCVFHTIMYVCVLLSGSHHPAQGC